MKRTEQPLDPEIAAQLDAIDATLAGEPVDPQHAELAELALLLAAQRPRPEPGFAASLDRRLARRFAAEPDAPSPGRRRRRSLGWLGGLASAAAAAAVVVVVVSSGGGSGGSVQTSSLPQGTTSAPSAAAAAPPSRAISPSAGPAAGVRSTGSTAFAPLTATAAAPQPPANGRKIIQSANLALTTAATHIGDVAQEVFDVVGRENGVVNSSSVTAGSGGYAQFRLSIPSASLGETMTALSQLRYASVASRTDTTQDVNGQYISATRQLADDRALRTSLLKQLANATTQTQIDSLKAQIQDAEGAIARDEAALRSLNNQINYSQVLVTINDGVTPFPVPSSGGGFTLHKAVHDAGRVLTVAAGVALIAAAALVPVLLVGALGWWIAAALRRRRREHALDTA